MAQKRHLSSGQHFDVSVLASAVSFEAWSESFSSQHHVAKIFNVQWNQRGILFKCFKLSLRKLQTMSAVQLDVVLKLRNSTSELDLAFTTFSQDSATLYRDKK